MCPRLKKGKTGKPGTDGKSSGVIPPAARLPRVAVVDVAHHVTQRGNGGQLILAADSEGMPDRGQCVTIHEDGGIDGNHGRFSDRDR
jgi:hypothetical protein